MTSVCYFVAWDDSGCLLGCLHEHPTISETVECINCAGAYVVAIESGVLRALTVDEESEFKRLRCASHTDKPPHGAIQLVPVNRPAMKRENETLVEYVSRFLESYGISQPALTKEENRYPRVSRVQSSGFIGFVLDWLYKWETRELERIFALQVPAWLEVLGKRVRQVLKQ